MTKKRTNTSPKGHFNTLRCLVDRNGMHPIGGKSRNSAFILHKIAREEKFHYLASKWGLDKKRLVCGRVMAPVVWLCFAIWGSVYFFFRPLRDLNRTRIRHLTDIPKMLWFALRYNMSPMYYYYFQLPYEPSHPEWIWRYLPAWEWHFIGRRINRIRRGDLSALDHKDKFVHFCREHQLPTIPTVPLEEQSFRDLEATDLFVKSSRGYGGRECLLLPYLKEENGWLLNTRVIHREALLSSLEACFGTETFIVQHRVRSHPEIRWLGSNVLVTVRALTAWNPSGEPVLLRATIRLPSEKSAFLDNSDQGGLAAPVDPLSGVITGPATNWVDAKDIIHPISSSESIVGFQIPLWKDAVAVLHKAHRAADNFNFLGWDVAFTEEGVLLVECNVWSDIDLVQIPQNKPFLSDDILSCFQAEPSLAGECQN